MKILGIESSCDETAAAVVEDGRRLLSNVVQSQIDIHTAFGGVVPEIAARSHLEVILPVIDRAVSEAGGWEEIDAIAVTVMPGLVGSLLVGSLTARTLALIKNKPLFPVHHVEAHVYANFIEQGEDLSESESRERVSSPSSRVSSLTRSPSSRVPQEYGSDKSLDDSSNNSPFPLLSLIVSGGHSQIVLFRDHGDYELIGQTADDAVGEAFDKVAKMLGLPYPGGPSIAKVATHGDATKYQFPKARMEKAYDFSFSGLKTAVLRAIQREVGVDHTFPSHELSRLLTASQRNDFAASFQRVAIETLVDKVAMAVKEFAPRRVVIAGGVAANSELRRMLSERLPIEISFPPVELCTDNAVMVASLGYFMSKKVPPSDPRAVSVAPSISMTKTAWGVS